MSDGFFLCSFQSFEIFFFPFSFYIKACVACCTQLLLLHTSCGEPDKMTGVGRVGGSIKGRHDGEWWMGCHGDEGRACYNLLGAALRGEEVD